MSDFDFIVNCITLFQDKPQLLSSGGLGAAVLATLVDAQFRGSKVSVGPFCPVRVSCLLLSLNLFQPALPTPEDQPNVRPAMVGHPLGIFLETVRMNVAAVPRLPDGEVMLLLFSLLTCF